MWLRLPPGKVKKNQSCSKWREMARKLFIWVILRLYTKFKSSIRPVSGQINFPGRVGASATYLGASATYLGASATYLGASASYWVGRIRNKANLSQT